MMQGEISLDDPRAIADIVREVCARELPTLIGAAVREALAGSGNRELAQIRARAALRQEQRDVADETERTERELQHARQIAARTIADALRARVISGGDPTGYARHVELMYTGLPAPLDWVPVPPDAWRR